MNRLIANDQRDGLGRIAKAPVPLTCDRDVGAIAKDKGFQVLDDHQLSAWPQLTDRGTGEIEADSLFLAGDHPNLKTNAGQIDRLVTDVDDFDEFEVVGIGETGCHLGVIRLPWMVMKLADPHIFWPGGYRHTEVGLRQRRPDSVQVNPGLHHGRLDQVNGPIGQPGHQARGEKQVRIVDLSVERMDCQNVLPINQQVAECCHIDRFHLQGISIVSRLCGCRGKRERVGCRLASDLGSVQVSHKAIVKPGPQRKLLNLLSIRNRERDPGIHRGTGMGHLRSQIRP